MQAPLPPDVRTFVEQRRVARLATADAQGHPHAVPIVYTLDGSRLYFALDAKPKSVPPERLRRVRNIAENPRVAVIVDDYREDWRRLAYVLLEGEAVLLSAGRREGPRPGAAAGQVPTVPRPPPPRRTRPSYASQSSERYPGARREGSPVPFVVSLSNHERSDSGGWVSPPPPTPAPPPRPASAPPRPTAIAAPGPTRPAAAPPQSPPTPPGRPPPACTASSGAVRP